MSAAFKHLKSIAKPLQNRIRLLTSNTDNIHFNLATEEYLFEKGKPYFKAQHSSKLQLYSYGETIRIQSLGNIKILGNSVESNK